MKSPGLRLPMAIRPRGRGAGYTLIEAVVALSIFLAVALPIFTYAFRGAHSTQARDTLTAAFLLEQEAARVKAMPASISPTRLRSVQGRTWRVTCDVSSDQPRVCRIKAEYKGKTQGEVVVMLFEAPKR